MLNKKILNDKLLNQTFGGEDRISKIYDFIKKIKSKYVTLKLIVLTPIKYYNILYDALSRLKLLLYCDLITKSAKSYFSSDKSWKIIQLKDQYELGILDQTILVTHDHLLDETDEFQKYIVKEQKYQPLNGLTIADFIEIDKLLLNPEYNFQNTMDIDEKTISLSEIHQSLFETIVQSTIKQNMRVISKCQTYIYEKMETNSDFYRFIEFQQQLNEAILSYKLRYWWIASQYFQNALIYDTSHFEIHKRKGKCLSYLKHYIEAEKEYQIALTLNPSHYKTNLSLAWHYIQADKPKKALSQFIYTYEIRGNPIPDKDLLTGLARAYELNGKDDESEIYYKLATNLTYNKYVYGLGHYLFGKFLLRFNRFQEAKNQLEISVNVCPNEFKYNHTLSITLHALNEFEKAKYYTFQSLFIDDHAQCALLEFKKYHKISIEDSTNIDPESERYNSQRQFDCFWFDVLNQVNTKFNRYYDELHEAGFNDINKLSNDFTLINIIKDIDPEDAKLIEYKLLQYNVRNGFKKKKE